MSPVRVNLYIHGPRHGSHAQGKCHTRAIIVSHAVIWATLKCFHSYILYFKRVAMITLCSLLCHLGWNSVDYGKSLNPVKIYTHAAQ